MSVLAALSRIRPTARIIPRGSSIVTGLSVVARSCFGITCRNSVAARCGVASPGSGPASRVAPDVALEIRVLAIARDPCALRLDRERRLAGPTSPRASAPRTRSCRRPDSAAPGRRERLRRAGPSASSSTARHALDEQVRVVPRRCRPRRGPAIVHLRIQPVGEGGQPPEQQQRHQPARRSSERRALRMRSAPRAGAPCAGSARRARSCAASISSAASRTAPAPPSRGRDVVRVAPHRVGRVRHGEREAARGEERHVGEVVAHVRAGRGLDPELRADVLPRRRLVLARRARRGGHRGGARDGARTPRCCR